MNRSAASLRTGGAEAPLPAVRLAKRLDRNDLDMGDRRHDELGDAIAAADGEGLGSEIDEEHHDLAAIIGVDGAGAVQERHPVLQR